ncbi:hypothetical protein KDRO_D00130 [Kluyveromyces lactis]|nr:hypothetical protein KDRO_D00130 [Kluyveromyces lactis]
MPLGPWAHRAFITRVLKGLTSVIGISVVHWHMDDKGWRFLPYDESNKPGEKESFTPSAGLNPTDELSSAGVGNRSVRYGTTGTVDHNYHHERLRQVYFKSEPDYPGRFTVPQELEGKIDEIHSWVYETIKHGIYKAGFAEKQEIYEKEVVTLFRHLDKVENILKERYKILKPI